MALFTTGVAGYFGQRYLLLRWDFWSRLSRAVITPCWECSVGVLSIAGRATGWYGLFGHGGSGRRRHEPLGSRWVVVEGCFFEQLAFSFGYRFDPFYD